MMACKDCKYFFRIDETMGRCQGKKYAPRVDEYASCTRFTQSKHREKLEMADRLEHLRVKLHGYIGITMDDIEAVNYAISMLRVEEE